MFCFLLFSQIIKKYSVKLLYCTFGVPHTGEIPKQRDQQCRLAVQYVSAPHIFFECVYLGAATGRTEDKARLSGSGGGAGAAPSHGAR